MARIAEFGLAHLWTYCQRAKQIRIDIEENPESYRQSEAVELAKMVADLATDCSAVLARSARLTNLWLTVDQYLSQPGVQPMDAISFVQAELHAVLDDYYSRPSDVIERTASPLTTAQLASLWERMEECFERETQHTVEALERDQDEALRREQEPEAEESEEAEIS